MTDELRAALAGEVIATFEDLHDEEDSGEAALGVPLLEVYSPIREAWSGEIIGVAEFYEIAEVLHGDLRTVRLLSWLTVIGVLTVIGGALYLIVLQGSRTIVAQQGELTRQNAALRALSDRNAGLRRRVSQAAARAAALNEATLRGVGADLHDGPAQYMGYAALRLDGLRRHAPDDAARADFDAVSTAIADSIRELRQISRGLALPDIERRTPCEILSGVAEAHSARTGAPVALDCRLADDLPLSEAARICLYRVAQEGLTNGWRHGGGADQSLEAHSAGGTLHLAVRDRGPGPGQAQPDPDGGLGLAGLRDRVESLGGTVVLMPRGDGPGAELTMILDLEESHD
nr:histidine kinase [Mesobacterium pallidum]